MHFRLKMLKGKKKNERIVERQNYDSLYDRIIDRIMTEL